MHFANKRLSDTTIERYEDAIHNLNTFRGKRKLTFDLIREWLSTIDNYNTFNICYSAVKSYLRELYKDKPATQRQNLAEFFAGMRWQKPNKVVSETQYLTKDRIYDLISCATERTGCFIMALFQTGCRVSELINITMNSCRIDGDYVYTTVRGKRGKERTVVMQGKLYNKIRHTFKGSRYLFETVEGNRYAREYVSKKIKEAAEQAGFEGVSAHTLRHSKAMYMKEKGFTPDEIAKALGHASASTTLDYYFNSAPSAHDQLKDI